MFNFKTSLFTIAIMALAITACKKNDIITPSYAEFVGPTTGTTVVNSYYVTSDATSSFVIPVGITNSSNSARTITYTVSSPTGAVAGQQYTVAGNSVTIPAGKVLDSIVVKGIFAGYPAGRKDTLVITLTGGDVPAANFNNTYKLVMQKYCQVNLTSIAGAYGNTNEYESNGAFSYGPYTTTVKNVTATSATTASGQISGIYDDGWNDINVVFNWTDPANFKVSIPLQPTGRNYSGGATSVRSSTAATAVNSFSSCDNSITLSLDLVNGSTLISSNYRVVLKR